MSAVDDTGAELAKLGDALKYNKRNTIEAAKFYDKAIVSIETQLRRW